MNFFELKKGNLFLWTDGTKGEWEKTNVARARKQGKSLSWHIGQRYGEQEVVKTLDLNDSDKNEIGLPQMPSPLPTAVMTQKPCQEPDCRDGVVTERWCRIFGCFYALLSPWPWFWRWPWLPCASSCPR